MRRGNRFPLFLSMNTAADSHPRESEDPGPTRTKLWIPGLRLRLAGNDRGERLSMNTAAKLGLFRVRVQLRVGAAGSG